MYSWKKLHVVYRDCSHCNQANCILGEESILGEILVNICKYGYIPVKVFLRFFRKRQVEMPSAVGKIPPLEVARRVATCRRLFSSIVIAEVPVFFKVDFWFRRERIRPFRHFAWSPVQ